MLRDYQAQAVDAVVSALKSGERVCLVAPTGAGKTVMMCAAAAALDMQTVWVTHRDALIDQSAAALEKAGLSTGIYSAKRTDGLDAQVIVASWQTLVARSEAPKADLVLFDEAHHVQGKKWSTVLDHYPTAKVLGATATPQRGDGRALGDIFSTLVIAAQYSELIKAGFLTPCRVFSPPSNISPNLAREPLVAYQEKCPGTKAIGFASDIDSALGYANEFTKAGYPSRVISQRTKPAERIETIAAFKRGQILVLWSVNVLTEGFDVPDAQTCIIARGCQHAGTYLQMVGRVLRAAEGKTTAFLLDLAGVCNTHGLPTCDRRYSLEGKAILPVNAMKQCRKCGFVWDPPETECPDCGWSPPATARAQPIVVDEELIERAEADVHMINFELERLRVLQRSRGYSLEWVQVQMKRKFQKDIVISDATEQERLREFKRLQELAEERGYKPGFAKIRYRNLFGHWPRNA